MRRILLILGVAALLFGLTTACGLTGAEKNFVDKLRSDGYTVKDDVDGNVKTETEDKEKTVGKTKKKVKKGVRIIEVKVEPVRGCVLEFERHESDGSYYWLDELHQNGEHEWPDHPESLSRSAAVTLMDDARTAKPAHFNECYKKEAA